MTGHEGFLLQSAYYSSDNSHDYYLFIDFTKFCFTTDQKATSKRFCIDISNIILSSVYIKNSLICKASHFVTNSHFNKHSLNQGYVWQFCNLLQLPSPFLYLQQNFNLCHLSPNSSLGNLFLNQEKSTSAPKLPPMKRYSNISNPKSITYIAKKDSIQYAQIWNLSKLWWKVTR